jgi:hypothetical protein
MNRWPKFGVIAFCVIGFDPAWVRADEGEQPPAPEEAKASYVQSGVIQPQSGQGAILGFCVGARGGLVAVVGKKGRFGAGPQPAGGGQEAVQRVIWFDADGAESQAIELDFAATCIASAPEGGFYVAGDGVVARLSAEGEEVLRAATPGAVLTEEERAELEQSVVEKRDAAITAYDKQITRIQSAIEELGEKKQKLEKPIEQPGTDQQSTDQPAGEEAPDGEQSEADAAEEQRAAAAKEKNRRRRLHTLQSQERRLSEQLNEFEAMSRRARAQEPADLVHQALQKTRQVRAITAADDAVFVVLGESSGYGYAAWRLDGRLRNPEKVLAKLVGCCGQMDVQVIGDRLAVAANRKHCVELFDFDGETSGKAGARAAKGDDGAGFGGCCNPMNTCPAPDGTFLTSESNGLVKRFNADGEFVEIVGKAEVRGGCKNSAIAIEPDGKRLYYIDSSAGRVLVLAAAEPVSNVDVANPEVED